MSKPYEKSTHWNKLFTEPKKPFVREGLSALYKKSARSTDTYLIRGLMALGRTRQQAIDEAHAKHVASGKKSQRTRKGPPPVAGRDVNMLSNRNLVSVESQMGGVQRLYRLGRYGLSCMNGPMLRPYTFAWEIGVIRYRGGADEWSLCYDTSLTSDIEVFATDDAANAFIERAFDFFAQDLISQ